jgi:hypothetical protein
MIEAKEIGFRASRNEPFRLALKFTEEGVPKDVTGWTVKMSLATAEGVTPALVSQTGSSTANGSTATLTAPTTGDVEILLTKLDMEALNTGTTHKILAYDILAGPSGGDVNRYYFGAFQVDLGVGT